MVVKYSKNRRIQHFEIGDIISIKIPREDRTGTDNKRLFGKILSEPYPHRYQVVTASGLLKRLIPTKSIVAVDRTLWQDIYIAESNIKISLREAAKDASSSTHIRITC